MSDKGLPAKYLEFLQEMALTRRRFLHGSASVAGMLAMSQFLAACAPSTVAEPASTSMEGSTLSAAAGEPKTGGTLIFAAEAIGESLDPGLWNGFGISNVIDNVGGCLTRPNQYWCLD